MNVDASTEKFVNYWRAKTGRDSTKRDWRATWDNWLISDFEKIPARRSTAAQRNLSTVEHFARLEQKEISA